MERSILHSDMNSCYASIELLYHPELRGRPLAVGGDPEARHGIVLAKNPIAKAAGVRTGMALWQAREACPEIVFVPPRMDLYKRFSRECHRIYRDYTDLQEPFGIDECWLDVTASRNLKGGGEQIAQEIRNRVKKELGITVSIGVSWNKVYAKLGSDYKKPDAVTCFTRENYKELVYPLPVGDLLYVGPASERKLTRCAVGTIGQLAEADDRFLQSLLGKMGGVLKGFAAGLDPTPVAPEGKEEPMKSIGNSTTTPRDLTGDDDAAIILLLLAESVGARLREAGLAAGGVEIGVRDNELYHFSRQCLLTETTDLTKELYTAGLALFRRSWRWQRPIRSLGLRAIRLSPADEPHQVSLYQDERARLRAESLDRTVDDLRRRFGFYSVQRGLACADRTLSGLNAKEDNTVHPHAYLRG